MGAGKAVSRSIRRTGFSRIDAGTSLFGSGGGGGGGGTDGRFAGLPTGPALGAPRRGSDRVGPSVGAPSAPSGRLANKRPRLAARPGPFFFLDADALDGDGFVRGVGTTAAG